MILSLDLPEVPAKSTGGADMRIRRTALGRAAVSVSAAMTCAVVSAGAAGALDHVDRSPGLAPADPALNLWYDEPATDWETQSLPIGNGALGASVFGGVQNEQLQFNEKTLWTGGPGVAGYNSGNWTSPRPDAIKQVQDKITADGQADPEWVASVLGQPKTGFGA